MTNDKNIVYGTIQAGGNVHIGDITYIINHQEVRIPIRLTNFIPTDDSHVVGREEELTETYQKLASGKPTVLVNGIGGIGKTTLALKYMVRYAPQYRHVAWLNAAAGIQSAFIDDVALLDALHIKKEAEDAINAAQADRAFDLVFKRLNDLANTEGRAESIDRVTSSHSVNKDKILVVLDNANDLDDLENYEAHFHTAHVHLLITSRVSPEDWQVIKVESLPREQAIQLFKNYYPSVSATDEELDDLLSKLFYHTLLIELVARAASKSTLEFETLRQAINEKFIHDPELQKHAIKVSRHSHTMKEDVKHAKIEEYIWLIFKSVKDLPDAAKEMLRAFALLPPATPFNADFLTQHFAQWHLTEDVYDVLDISLVERGWLDRSLVNNKVAYAMHPLIAEVVVEQLDVTVDYADNYINVIAKIVYYDSANPADNLFTKKEFESLAARLVVLFFEKNTEGVSLLLNNLNWYYQQFGFYQKAVVYGERALSISQNLSSVDEDTISARQNNLASAYSNLGRYEETAQLLEKALANVIKNFGEDHPDVAACQSNLALVYSDLGRYESAAQLLETALASNLKNFGQDHPEVAIKQSNLANVYSDLGRYESAAQLLETALASNLKNFGQDHPEVAIKQSNLANIYSDLGRYESAAQLLETALASNLKNFGKDHPTVAVGQSNLANVYSDLGRYESAAQLLETALASDLKNFDKDHPTVANRQSNLANVYIYLERYESAAQLLETALASDLKNFGKDHPSVAVSQSNLANVYKYLKRYDRAAQLLETALASDLKNFGKDHPTVAVSQSNLANVYKDLKRYDQAAQLLETALASDLKNFGKDHPAVAFSQNNLAWVYYETGHKAEAKVLWTKAYANFLENFGAGHPHTQSLKKYSLLEAPQEKKGFWQRLFGK